MARKFVLVLGSYTRFVSILYVFIITEDHLEENWRQILTIYTEDLRVVV
jgi:hypothetical protein